MVGTAGRHTSAPRLWRLSRSTPVIFWNPRLGGEAMARIKPRSGETLFNNRGWSTDGAATYPRVSMRQ